MKRLLFLSLLMAMAINIRAQRITRSYDNVPLPKALMELNNVQHEYNVCFIYDDLRDYTVTATIENASVQDAIKQMTGLYNIKMIVVGKTILVESGAARHRLRGTVINSKNKPVEYVNIALLSLKDSTLITGGVSNEQGRFVIPCEEDEVIMRMSCMGMKTLYRRIKTGYIGTVRMQADKFVLDAVTVKGESYIRKEDMVIIIPNKLDTKHAYTGYDLLYNLMIPGIDVDRKAGTVNAMGGTVTLYINGVKAEFRDIKNLRPKEVIKIEYMEVPTGKYSGDDASINFIVKTYKAGGYVALDGSQTIGYTEGDYNVATKLSCGSTSFTLYVGHTMQDYTNTQNHETEEYHLTDYSLTRDNSNSEERIKSNKQYAQFKIQNQDDKRTLQAKLALVCSAEPENSTKSLLAYSDLYDNSSSSVMSSSQSVSPSFELYGAYRPNSIHRMELRIGGTYSNNRYDRSYLAGDYSSLSNVREDLFEMPVSLKYTLQLKNKTSLTSQIWNMYRNSSTNYYGSSTSWQHLWSNETLFFIYHNWRINERIKLNNRLGFSYEAYHLHGNEKVTHFSPRYNTTFSYRISKKQQLFANFSLGNTYPDISSLNSAEQAVDMLHVKRGNPYLDNSVLYGYSIRYNLNLGRFSVLCGFGSENGINYTLPVFSAEGGKVVETYYSDDNIHSYGLNADLSYRPVDVLKIRLVGSYNKYKVTGLRNLDCDNFHLRMYLTYYWKDFAVNLYWRTKRKDFNEQCAVDYCDPAYCASISWTHGNWYAELYAKNFFTRNYERRTELQTEVYGKTSYHFNRPEQRSAFIKLAYTFEFGKKTKRDDKDVNTTVNSAILKAE